MTAVQDHTKLSRKRNNTTRKQEVKASVQELASRAASRVKAVAAKKITPPNSAYQFEVSWRGFSGNNAQQTSLLKAISPSALPQILKNALTVPILLDIIKCVATFFVEKMDLVVNYLENLTRVPRFDTLIMFLSSSDNADLVKIWDEVFDNEATPIEYAETLRARSKTFSKNVTRRACIQSTAPSDDKAQQVSTLPSSTSCTVNSSCKILKCSNDPFESQIISSTTFLSIYRDVKSTLQLLLLSCWT
ncbi:hypothetical protein CerSpe_267580 [Prunus speciosa]